MCEWFGSKNVRKKKYSDVEIHGSTLILWLKIPPMLGIGVLIKEVGRQGDEMYTTHWKIFDTHFYSVSDCKW